MKKTKILVIRFRRIGDSVLSLSVIKSLKKTIPDSEIHYVLDDYMTDIFEIQSCIDKVIPFTRYEKKSLPTYLKKVWTLSRKEKYDIVIDMRSTVNTLFFSLFSFGAKYRIGVRKAYNILLQNYRVNIQKETDYVNQQLTLLDPLSKDYNVVKDTQFEMNIPKHFDDDMKRYMESKGINFSKPVLMCTVASRVKDKQWNINYMTEVINLILNKYDGIQIIFNYGNEEEKDTAKTIYANLNSPKQIFIDIEAVSLVQLGALLSNINYLFGNEGGVRHIAQALNIPSFAIFSPGNSIHNWLPNRSFRYDGIDCEELNNYNSIRNLDKQSLYDSITPEIVWNKLEHKLDKYLNPTEKLSYKKEACLD